MVKERVFLKNELRVLLTAKCNYKCFFCHSEGVDPDANYELKTKEEILESVKKAVSMGYNDVSFTGGEPLVRKNDLSYIIKELGKEAGTLPDLTVVTNGALLDDDFIKLASQYPGNFKFNVSLHSFSADIYDKVTVTENNNLNKVLANIKKIKEIKIKLKLNCVLMKGLNTSEKEILEHINKAQQLNADAVKLLELLVLPENWDMYRYFFSADAIKKILEKYGFAEVLKSMRGCVMNSPDYQGIDVEVVKCTCKVGCSNCLTVSARFLGPDLNHYPCFIHSEQPVIIDSSCNMSEAFEKGDRIISLYAEEYKDDSPILIEQEKYLKQRLHSFFYTGFSFEDVIEKLKKLGFKHAKIREFSYFYTRPKKPSGEWLNFEKTLSYGFDSYSPNKVEFIYSTHKYSLEKGVFCAEQSFIDWLAPPPHCESVEQAEDIIAAIDFETYFHYDYEFHNYRKDDFEVSIDRKSKKVNFRVKFNDTQTETFKKLQKELNLKMIKIPFLKWFLKEAKVKK